MATDINKESNFKETINNVDDSLNKESNFEEIVANSVIHTVDGSANNQMSDPTIQNAIDKASSGDTILITGKDYVHCHFVINKKLNIVSEVGTKMSTCPSNTDGSKGVGIFYFGEGASGSVLSGFTLINSESKKGSIDPYSVYIKGNDNVTIKNSNIKTSEGPGIYISDTSNTLIIKNNVSDSKNGILIEKSNNVNIIDNEIKENNISGINIGLNVLNPYIFKNTIHANNYFGISFFSSVNAIIQNNRITENRDDKNINRAKNGAGIYVDCNITNMKIFGNYIQQNGAYGIYDTDNVKNLINQHVQVINNNYFVNHNQRVAYHSVNGNTGPIYLWSNYYSQELFCGGTAYEPGVLISNHERDLVISNIKQIEKGLYSISFLRQDTGEIASYLSSVDITFFLNKVDSNPIPSSKDIYKIVRIVNGTATVDFRDANYLSTGNNITAIGPGIGAIDYSGSYRPVVFLKISDTDIPKTVQSILTGNDLNLTFGNENYFSVRLTDVKGNILSNKEIIFNINGKNYSRTTNDKGIASLKINLIKGTYIISTLFKGDDDYSTSSIKNKILVNEGKSEKIQTILKGNDLILTYGNNNVFEFLLTVNNNPLVGETIKISISGVDYFRTTDENGIAKLNIRLIPGAYSIKGEFLAKDNYLSSSANNNIIINSPSNEKIETKLNGNDLNQIFGENKPYTIFLKDINDNPLVRQNIKITINGVDYYKISDDEGKAKIAIKLIPGTYSVSSFYEGNDLYSTSYNKNELIIRESTTKLDVNLNIQKENWLFGENKPLIINLTEKNSKSPISNQNILININGVIYERITDENGIAKLNIRLHPGNYQFSVNYLGNSYYNSFNLEDTVLIKEISGSKVKTNLTGINLVQTFGENKAYTISLKDINGNNLIGQNIKISINGVDYIRTTDENGQGKITIRLHPGDYHVKTEYLGNSLYEISNCENDIKVLKGIFIFDKSSNEQIQNIINSAHENSILIFNGKTYENIALNINKPLKITGLKNTTVKGSLNKAIFTVNSKNVQINNFNIIAKNASGILLKNSDLSKIIGNNITNILDDSKKENYMNGKELLSGYGIKIEDSSDILISNNNISLFYSGIELEDSKHIIMKNNLINKNNYGILYENNVSDTLVEFNNITNSIGIITMKVVEGPLGYGIYLKDSADSVKILNNNLLNNYIGIFIDSKNSTAIKIAGNLITESTLEGIVFYANYTYLKNGKQPLIESNAIFNNAKGPGLIVLGEISANPGGIYGPGEFNNSLRLKLGSNWYGTNEYLTWSENGTQGAGTICPRINTTLIIFNISYIDNGKYKVSFYNNGKVDKLLPEFKMYFTLNYLTNKQIEKIITIKNGEGILEFKKDDYSENNIVEGSCGSLNDINRIYHVIFKYIIPNKEIPK
jgi:parallel beta-helix repeat protein